jgi:hypothetical protein
MDDLPPPLPALPTIISVRHAHDQETGARSRLVAQFDARKPAGARIDGTSRAA